MEWVPALDPVAARTRLTGDPTTAGPTPLGLRAALPVARWAATLTATVAPTTSGLRTTAATDATALVRGSTILAVAIAPAPVRSPLVTDGILLMLMLMLMLEQKKYDKQCKDQCSVPVGEVQANNRCQDGHGVGEMMKAACLYVMHVQCTSSVT